MTTSAVLLAILLVLVIAATPTWSYSRDWGYRPSGILGLILVALVILALLDKI